MVLHVTGNLASTWRTPPPSPPTRQAFLGGAPGGLRRAASMDISTALNTPVRMTGEIGVRAVSPGTGNVTPGLSDALGMSAMNLDSPASAPLLPESTFYRWSCGHFSRPLLEPVHDDEEENLARRERREREALSGIAMCQRLSE